MSGARRYLFGDDLRRPEPDGRGTGARAATEAYARGVDAGRMEAAAETEQLLAAALDRIGAGLAAGLGRMAEAEAAIETEAMAFFETLARGLAGQALAERPLGPIRDAAEAAFRHLRGVPHLAVRVNANLVDAVDALLGRLARERGFEGRIIVLGDEGLAPGDARFEWADGGIVGERRRIEDAVAAILTAAAPAAADGTDP